MRQRLGMAAAALAFLLALSCTPALAGDASSPEGAATPATVESSRETGGQDAQADSRQPGASPASAAPSAPQTASSPQIASPSSPLPTSSPLSHTAPSPAATPGRTGQADAAAGSRPQVRPSAAWTVSFDTAGGSSIGSQTIPDGSQASRPTPDPSRDGYLFDGWFQDNIAYDFSQPVTGSTTLTARWTSTGTQHWTISPSQGPAAGGTKTTLTPPAQRSIRFSQISIGYFHSAAIGSDGNLYTWGDNSDGQLGDGTNTNRNTPAPIGKPAGAPAGFTWQQIGQGCRHSAALGSDGNLYTWGDNSYGELGDGTTTNRNKPTLVEKPAGAPAGFTWKQVRVGSWHTAAFGSDGNLYIWGYNGYGNLGDGTTTNRNKPTLVEKPAGAPAGFTWKQVRLGYWHTAAFGSDGQLYTWGNNYYGQLGDGTNTDRYRPVQVVKPQGAPDGFTWKQIILGGYHCAAFGSDGNLYTWGENEYGELGDGTNTNRNKPIQVGKPAGASDGFTWKQIFLGDWHSAAIGSDGNLYTWGYNSNGQLGDGTNTNRNMPTMVSKPQGAPAGFAWQQASLGWQHTEAIGSDGQLYAWGGNSSGQLGDGTTADRHDPGRVSMPGAATPTKVLFGQAKATGITAGPDGTWQATTPGHDPGTVDVTIVWNRNGPQPDAHLQYTFTAPKYQVGFASANGSCPAPTGMPASQTVVQGGQAERPYPDPKAEGCLFDGWFQGDVAYDFTRPVTEDVTLTARWSPAGVHWAISPTQGPESGGTEVTLTPSPARGIRFSQTSTGSYHSAAIGSNGQLYTWGDNSQGQLGRATDATSPAGQPGRVTKPADAPKGFTWKQVSLGGTYSAAIGSDGQLYTWGDNSQGQLGRSVTAASPADRPGKVDKPADAPEGFAWKQVSLGRQRSAAIGSDGQLYTWGDEGTGGLGRDVTAASPADRPGKVDKPADAPEGFAWKQVSLGYYHSAAIGSDGSLYTWSDNNDTQLGRGTSSSNPAGRPGKIDKPADAPEGFAWKQVSLGDYHSAAIGSDGSLYTWGGNNYDQLGRSITDATPSNKPGLVPKPAGAPEGFAWQQIGLGRRHSAATGSDGQLYTWGGANYGQLGRSVTAASPAGRPGLVPKPAGAPEGFAWQLASLGRRHSAATGSNGQLYTWGNNSYGQLGDGNTTKNRQAPNPVNPPSTAAPTQVKFGQALGETLTADPDGTWQVTTPAYTPGPVTVAIDWTQDGKQQQTDTSNAYRYLSIASLPLTGGDGMLLLLATGLLAAGAATAAKNHRQQQTRTAA